MATIDHARRLSASTSSSHRACARAVRRSSAEVPSSTRSEEHTSALQSLMRISYAVFCVHKKTKDPLYTLLTNDTTIDLNSQLLIFNQFHTSFQPSSSSHKPNTP